MNENYMLLNDRDCYEAIFYIFSVQIGKDGLLFERFLMRGRSFGLVFWLFVGLAVAKDHIQLPDKLTPVCSLEGLEWLRLASYVGLLYLLVALLRSL